MSQARPNHADHEGFFDYCPWRFKLWATQAEQVRQLEQQQTLLAAGGVNLGQDCFAALGYTPQGVHRLPAAWSQT